MGKGGAMGEDGRLRAVVCGSRFGQFYLEALKGLPEQFELAGLLAKGSDRSKECAERYGIPLYTDVGEVPEDIDLACVVLRSGVMGGSGTELSLKFLERGIHVIQEQPVHHRDLALCLRTARENGVCFQIGDLYVHLPAVRRFIACVREVLEHQEPLFIDAACATQVSFPMMHILHRFLPETRPWHINHVIKDEGPFQLLAGSLGEVPVTLRAHNEVDPDDPDNHLHLLHRLTIGFGGGSLSLTDTHGPVVWRPRLHVSDNHTIFDPSSSATPVYLLENSTQILGSPGPAPYKEILMKQWPRAIGRDLSAMGEMILEGGRMDASAQQALLCCRQWQDLTHALGYPVLRANRSHRPISVDLLKEAALKIADDPDERFGMALCPGGRRDVFACIEYAEGVIQGVGAGQVSAWAQRLDEAVLTSMLFALQSQGTLIQSDQGYGTVEVFSTAGVVPRHQPLVLRWLQILVACGYLKQEGEDFLVTEVVTPEMFRHRWDLVREAWDGRLGPKKVSDYFIANAEQLPELMKDKQQAALLLFPEGRMDVADALYRETLAARYLNRSVAEAVVRIAAVKQSESHGAGGDSLNILEIGAGTGATTARVAHRLKSSVSERLKPDYLFTDLSHFFLSTARERFKDCPWMRFRILDMDLNLFEQGIATESVDIVIAAGMLNNVKDTDQVVSDLMRSLVPGGWMLITEAVQESLVILMSQAFMMTRPEDDRKNTQTTFMSVEQWLDVFHGAGAEEVVILPGEDHSIAPFGQKLFIVRKGTHA